VSLSARDRLRSIPRAGLGAGAGILGMLPQGRGVKVQPPTPT
jgi:hypothetical protein